MKVNVRIRKVVDVEMEVDDKYKSLSDDAFWVVNPFKADCLSGEMAIDIENSEEDIEVIYVEDMNGNMLFEG